jgi:hypothetical protein
MATLLAAILAAIPNALLAIGAKLFTDKFLQMVLQKVIIAGLEKAASLSINTIDDEVVADIKKRFQEAN